MGTIWGIMVYREKILSALALIAEPMRPQCRVAVAIPVYDEDLRTLLLPLASLARQKGARFEEFEAVFVVNNIRAEAAAKSPAFRQNQKALAVLNYLAGSLKRCPGGLPVFPRRQIIAIRRGGLIVRVIDKSSLKLSSEANNVGLARDIAGAEICRRFFSVSAGENGIIAQTDADCRFSKNYITELIKTFADPAVNGAAGLWRGQAAPGLPHKKFVQQALSIHFGREVTKKNYQRPADGLPIRRQKQDRLGIEVLGNGQNLAVRARAWLEVGGMPHLQSLEDMIFGRRIAALPGEIIYNPNFYVIGLIRPSARVGFSGFGRRVASVIGAIDDFAAGKTDKIFILDRLRSARLFAAVYRSYQRGELSAAAIKRHLLDAGSDTTDIDEADLAELAAAIAADLGGDIHQAGLPRTEKLVVEKFYRHLPKIALG